MDKYLTPEELRGVADACESLRPLWDLLTGGNFGGISFDCTDFPGVDTYDSNGDLVGRITWADGGPSFYPASDE